MSKMVLLEWRNNDMAYTSKNRSQTPQVSQSAKSKKLFQDLYDHIDQLEERVFDTRKLLPKSQREERIKRSYSDPAYFYKTYLPNYFKNNPAPYHQELPILFQFKQRPLVVLAPRGGAKTTFLFGETLRRIALGIDKFIIRVEVSEDVASKEMYKIRYEIETNRQLYEDFGDLKGSPWQALELYFSNGSMLWGRGSKQPIRGATYLDTRPTGIIYNDVETIKQVQNQDTTDAIYDALLLDALPALRPQEAGGGFLAIVGTLLGQNSMLSKMREAPLAKQIQYEALEGDMEIIELLLSKVARDIVEIDYYLRDNTGNDKEEMKKQREFFYNRPDYMELIQQIKSYWPERYPVEDLLIQAVKMGISSFKQEYLHIPIDSDGTVAFPDSLFSNSDSQYEIYMIPDNHQFVRAIFLDPSQRGAKSNDDTAFVTIFYDQQDRVGYVIDVTAGKMTIEDMVALSFDLAEKYLLGDVVVGERIFPREQFVDSLFGYEDNGAQQWLESIFHDNSGKYGFFLPKLTGITHTGNKIARISQLSYYMEHYRIKFNFDSDQQKILKNELRGLGSKRLHDDRADALESCWSLVEKVNSNIVFAKKDASLEREKSAEYHFREPIYKKQPGRILTDRLQRQKSRMAILGKYRQHKLESRGYRG